VAVLAGIEASAVLAGRDEAADWVCCGSASDEGVVEEAAFGAVVVSTDSVPDAWELELRDRLDDAGRGRWVLLAVGEALRPISCIAFERPLI
jgi:hypothetical protein